MTQALAPVSAMQLTVCGVVQGIGFRPYIWRQAKRFGLNGRVSNTPSGVTIRVEGTPESLEQFVATLPTDAPPLAHITEFTHTPVTAEGYSDFLISESTHGEAVATLIPADIATCAECLDEVNDPANRRFGYPFTNCTNCGPRYTLIAGLPYDRPLTSMAPFPMCHACREEYENPADRRFHAQPNACSACGPHVFLQDNRGEAVPGAPITNAGLLLKQGKIIAVKGLGGFHLAVDAADNKAVSLLRERKKRPAKPFAVMCRDLTQARLVAMISPEEEALLNSTGAPIVLLRKTPESETLLAPELAPGVNTIGIMLPYTPLQHLLLKAGPPIQVMTSGNPSSEPVLVDNNVALDRLSQIADGFLMHNREILQRNDDSVTQVVKSQESLIRRARGYAPMPILLSRSLPPTLACGGILKNTLCLAKGNKAFLSQHIGDMENEETLDFFHHTSELMQKLLGIVPEVVAHDLHPDAASTRYAQSLKGVDLVPVQHHHAHIAACLADNDADGPVIGIALDGTGYGTDGTIWGGEVLLVEGNSFQRAAHLAGTPMPGGDAAVKAPWRMTAAHLLHHGILTAEEVGHRLPLPGHLFPTETVTLIKQMMEKGINSPTTSSMGRLFDAVSALIGTCTHVTFEGEAAIRLQAAAEKAWPQEPYPFSWHGEADTRIIHTASMFKGILDDMDKTRPVEQIAARFHATLVELFTVLCQKIRKETGLDRVALSGGVFQNRLLLREMLHALKNERFTVFTHHRVPAGDGGLSLGQAIVAGMGKSMPPAAR
ncbi:carbamoyltransferase HypF [Desulfoluna limicola]|uniref:Carbamoyltransferase n=1 Tax=Desulfoluna limicola TaxID=2810562 RepID=A0ABM7PGU2_9BACT|nr:carbamoyltransferase HypF [Desulfoluna limicola]BCS96772.1 carbamoyltransferase HypF [Desulfoluna limicola]